MSGKIFLLIVKIILLIVKTILLIVMLETGSALACAKICFEIFGCARHSPNKFGSALACAKIREISATDQVAILLIERD